MNALNLAKICNVYSKTEIEDKVQSMQDSVISLDIIFDLFQKVSQKRETCEDRGKNDGVRLSIKENNPIYRNFAKMLKADGNKTELFSRTMTELSKINRTYW